MGVMAGSNDIMDLMGLIGVPLAPPMLSVVIFNSCEVCFCLSFITHRKELDDVT